MALRKKTFGFLSFVPFAAAVSAAVWFFSLPHQLSGGSHNVFQTSATSAHVTMWFILGYSYGLTSTPQGVWQLNE